MKMNVLPKFLFLFQSIPLYLPKSFFKALDQLFTTFIWDGKCPRVSKSALQTFSTDGDLSLPNFLFYYWSAHIHKTLHWLQSSKLLWCKLETESFLFSSPLALLTSPLPLKASKLPKKPSVLSTIRIWFQFRQHFKFTAPSMLMSILNNHLFISSSWDAAFITWYDRGIKSFSDLFKDGVFRTFADISVEFNLPSSHQFRYFQIRHCARSLFPDVLNPPTHQTWDDLLSLNPFLKSFISRVYLRLMDWEDLHTNKSKTAWEGELGLSSSDFWWNRASHSGRTCTPCARLQLIQFKVLHRIHRSKSQLSKFYPNTIDDQCDRCSMSPCDLSHMFFYCPTLQRFWLNCFDTMSKALGVGLGVCPLLAIFGFPAQPSTFTQGQIEILAFTSLMARRCSLLLWKSSKPSSILSWLQDVMYSLKLEKIAYTLKGNTDSFFSKWNSFMLYIDSLSVLPTK